MPTQKVDVSGGEFGIQFSGSGLTWKIAKGVTVSGTSTGVGGIYADSKLINAGAISGDYGGVSFEVSDPGDFTVTNKKSGSIVASFPMVFSGLDGALAFTNKGKIEGANAALYVSGSGKAGIKNAGLMTGELNGVYIYFQNATDSAKIENSGSIKAGNIGVFSFSDNGALITVHNRKGALIEAGEDKAAITVQERLVLKNDGKLDGHVMSGGYNDKVVSKGVIDGLVATGAGNDKVVLKNKVTGPVSLGEGNDKLVLKGKGKVGDVIDSGEGNDKVVLGKGADKLLFSTALDAATNVDTIKKFQSGKDKFLLEVDVFSTLPLGPLAKAAFHKGKVAADADDRIIYDKKSGALYYDADGAGGVDQVQFAKLDKGTKLKASDVSVVDYFTI